MNWRTLQLFEEINKFMNSYGGSRQQVVDMEGLKTKRSLRNINHVQKR